MTGDITVRNDISERIIRHIDFHRVSAQRRAKNGNDEDDQDDRRKRISSRPGLTNDVVSMRSVVLGGAAGGV